MGQAEGRRRSERLGSGSSGWLGGGSSSGQLGGGSSSGRLRGRSSERLGGERSSGRLGVGGVLNGWGVGVLGGRGLLDICGVRDGLGG